MTLMVGKTEIGFSENLQKNVLYFSPQKNINTAKIGSLIIKENKFTFFKKK